MLDKQTEDSTNALIHSRVLVSRALVSTDRLTDTQSLNLSAFQPLLQNITFDLKLVVALTTLLFIFMKKSLASLNIIISLS